MQIGWSDRHMHLQSVYDRVARFPTIVGGFLFFACHCSGGQLEENGHENQSCTTVQHHFQWITRNAVTVSVWCSRIHSKVNVPPVSTPTSPTGIVCSCKRILDWSMGLNPHLQNSLEYVRCRAPVSHATLLVLFFSWYISCMDGDCLISEAMTPLASIRWLHFCV